MEVIGQCRYLQPRQRSPCPSPPSRLLPSASSASGRGTSYTVITGVYLFAGLTLFGTFKTPALYMAALAFTAYGVHWFAIGWNRLREADARVNAGMSIAFLLISILGIIVFFKVGDAPVGGVFIGLTCVYVTEFLASLKTDLPKAGEAGKGRWASSASAPGSGSCTWCSPWR
jgi:hypothetical protein